MRFFGLRYLKNENKITLLVTFLLALAKPLTKDNLMKEKFALAHNLRKATIHHGRDGTVTTA